MSAMRFLQAVEAHGESMASVLKFAVFPMAKILIMCALGFIMTTSYINILSASGRKLLSKLVFTLFLPCLIFTQLGKAVSLQNLQQWWFIPVNVVLASMIGCFIGLLLVIIIRPPVQYRKFTIVMTGIGNIGNIPLVLIGAICRDQKNPFGDQETCNEQGVAYISFGQWVGAVIVYTFVYKMLSPPEPLEFLKPEQDVERGSSSIVPLLSDRCNNDESDKLASNIGSKASVPFEFLKLKQDVESGLSTIVPLVTDQCDNDEIQKASMPFEFSKLEQDKERGFLKIVPLLRDQFNNDESKRLASNIGSKIWTSVCKVSSFLSLQQILQPPVSASILALVVGTTPFLKNFLLTENAPLFFFTDSLNILGGAMIPCIMLVLGGNLAGGPGSSNLGLRTTVAITFTRLFIVPLGGLGVVTLADKFGFLPADDKMFRFVLLLQHTMPTSILAGAVATLRGVAEKEASAILFWEHISAVFSLAGWLVVFLNYLS